MAQGLNTSGEVNYSNPIEWLRYISNYPSTHPYNPNKPLENSAKNEITKYQANAIRILWQYDSLPSGIEDIKSKLTLSKHIFDDNLSEAEIRKALEILKGKLGELEYPADAQINLNLNDRVKSTTAVLNAIKGDQDAKNSVYMINNDTNVREELIYNLIVGDSLEGTCATEYDKQQRALEQTKNQQPVKQLPPELQKAIEDAKRHDAVKKKSADVTPTPVPATSQVINVKDTNAIAGDPTKTLETTGR